MGAKIQATAAKYFINVITVVDGGVATTDTKGRSARDVEGGFYIPKLYSEPSTNAINTIIVLL